MGVVMEQAVERTEGGASLRDGLSRDRMMSVHDPEMRQGHKSSSRRFDGHKAAIVVDTGTQLITAVDVLLGNALDNLGVLELVEQMLSLPKYNTGLPVEEAMGDAVHGDTRRAFADAGRTLIARVPTNTGGSSGIGSAFRTGTIRSALDFVPVQVAQILTLALFTSAHCRNTSPSTRLPGRISRCCSQYACRLVFGNQLVRHSRWTTHSRFHADGQVRGKWPGHGGRPCPGDALAYWPCTVISGGSSPTPPLTTVT